MTSVNTLGKEIIYVSQTKTPWLRTWIMGLIIGLFIGLSIASACGR
jgi:hypothetical protein